MNTNLAKLHSYPFEKLAKLKKGITPNPSLKHIPLSIGEPKHAPPQFVLDTLVDELDQVRVYPSTKGTVELRQSITDWLNQRFNLPTSIVSAEDNVLPVNGTREALFAIAQVVVDSSSKSTVMLPSPFYQIYEGAAILSGSEPIYLQCQKENQFLPDLSVITENQWQQCQLFYLCSPNNPTGQVYSKQDYQHLIELADKYDFVIVSDECYSEIYPDEDNPPTGLLEVCATIGRHDLKRCLVFHSLSKRSNLPGLRSGFVAGDAAIMKEFLKYRTYHGSSMSIPTQLASIKAWQDEEHVINNRILYREKFESVATILKDVWPLEQPQAGFNFWAKTPIDDEQFTQQLFKDQHITVLPGSYLSREINGINPGKNYVRMALVADVDQCIEAAKRIYTFFNESL